MYTNMLNIKMCLKPNILNIESQIYQLSKCLNVLKFEGPKICYILQASRPGRPTPSSCSSTRPPGRRVGCVCVCMYVYIYIYIYMYVCLSRSLYISTLSLFLSLFLCVNQMSDNRLNLTLQSLCHFSFSYMWKESPVTMLEWIT